jgi:hypothetical protein
MLLSRSSRAVWLASLAAVEGTPPPECPVDLNEIQYSVLLFDPTCWVRPTALSEELLLMVIFSVLLLAKRSFCHHPPPLTLLRPMLLKFEKVCQNEHDLFSAMLDEHFSMLALFLGTR